MPVESTLLMNVMRKASSDALHTLLLVLTLARCVSADNAKMSLARRRARRRPLYTDNRRFASVFTAGLKNR